MKSEKQMRAEGRKISRAIDNYTPLTNENRTAAEQKTLQEV